MMSSSLDDSRNIKVTLYCGKATKTHFHFTNLLLICVLFFLYPFENRPGNCVAASLLVCLKCV